MLCTYYILEIKREIEHIILFVSLTGPSVRGHAGLILPAPGADDDSVESPGHQAVEHTLVLALHNRLVLVEDVVVLDDHLVVVKVPCRMAPVHL